MSGLLPLVATVLRDQAALDAQKEIKELKARLEEAATHVEIIFDANLAHARFCITPAVMASKQFAKGSLSKQLAWQVQFHRSRAAKLSQLEKISVCVGGGFPIMSLCDAAMDPKTQIHFEQDDQEICICVYDMQLVVGLIDFSRAEWERVYQTHPIMTPQSFFGKFCSIHADARAIFVGVRFNAKAFRGPLRRLLPPESRDTVVAAMTRAENRIP